MDIREVPITVHKKITVGADNLAFRCPDQKESCEQSLSGEIVFDHFEGKEIRTDGSYELRFRDGNTERGHFRVDCRPPCG